MTSKELVRAAIRHQTTPRVPYCINLCPDAWEQVRPFADGKDQVAFLDNDIRDFYPPWWWWHDLGPDWKGDETPVSPMRGLGTGSYTAFFDEIKRAKDTAPDKYFLVRIYGSHFEMAYFARGFENLLADFVGDVDFARRLHRYIINRNLGMLENFLPLAEIDGVLLGSDWGTQRGPLMAPEVWDDVIRPGEQQEYDLIHAYGKEAWVHSCGNIEVLIPRLIDMGLDVINPVQPEAMDIAMLKRNYGSRITFWGGISTQHVLPFGTPDEVRREARSVRRMMSAGGGYIFSAAQDIQADVPPANLLALLETAREVT